MADDASPDERTEDPTPKRIKEFRDRGEVAKSQELGSVAVLFAGMAALMLTGPRGAERIFQQTTLRLQYAHTGDFEIETMQRTAIQFMSTIAEVIGPIVLIVMAAGVAVNLAQSGWLVSWEAVQLKWDRLNVFNKFKEIFLSSRTAFEGLKTLMKLVVIGVPLGYAVVDELIIVPGIMGMSAMQLGVHAANGAMRVSTKVAALLILIGAMDFAYQKWSLNRRMKMTFQELKEEMKDSEGDPWIKARRKQIARDMSMNRMMTAVPQADVVVNNPTHFSVALKYESGTGGAPRVVAKGQDRIALKIREIAAEHGVPMITDAPLARAIYKTVDVDKEIPAALYRAVAEVLAMVYRKRGHRPSVASSVIRPDAGRAPGTLGGLA